MYTWNGSSWVAEQLGTNALADLSITNGKIANATITSAKISSIDAGKITTGVLSAITIEGVEISGSVIKSERTETESGSTTNYKTLIENEILKTERLMTFTTESGRDITLRDIATQKPSGFISELYSKGEASSEEVCTAKVVVSAGDSIEGRYPPLEMIYIQEWLVSDLGPETSYTDYVLSSRNLLASGETTILEEMAKDPKWPTIMEGRRYLYKILKELLESSRFLIGDTETFNIGPYMGHLTNALKDLNVFFPHYKNADGLNVTVANVTLPNYLVVRTTGGTYLNNSGSTGIPKANLTVKSVTHRAGGFNVVFGMQDGSAFTNATNNTPVSVMISGNLTVTFTKA